MSHRPATKPLFTISALSENALILYFDQSISNDVINDVHDVKNLIDKKFADYVVDRVTSYASILIQFNVMKISAAELTFEIERLTELKQFDDLRSESGKQTNQQNKKIVEIPIYYGVDVGLDLPVIAEHSGLTIDEVVNVHSGTLYTVYAIGFAPGFAYMGSVDNRISVARKTKPRISVPKNSLGIANQQTAVYPSESPGGWNIIGRTPLELVDYSKRKPSLLSAGDQVRFVPIKQSDFLAMGGRL